METADNSSQRRNPLLNAPPLQPNSLRFLADWEISELILRLEAEQRRREQKRWEEAERVRRGNPKPCFHLCAYCRRFVPTNLAPFGSINNMSVKNGTDAICTGISHHSLGIEPTGQLVQGRAYMSRLIPQLSLQDIAN